MMFLKIPSSSSATAAATASVTYAWVSLSSSPPAHRVRINTEGMITFFLHLIGMEGQSHCVFLFFCFCFLETDVSPDVLFLSLKYKRCGFAMEVFRVRVGELVIGASI